MKVCMMVLVVVPYNGNEYLMYRWMGGSVCWDWSCVRTPENKIWI